jgi:hypothetical protein
LHRPEIEPSNNWVLVPTHTFVLDDWEVLPHIFQGVLVQDLHEGVVGRERVERIGVVERAQVVCQLQIDLGPRDFPLSYFLQLPDSKLKESSIILETESPKACLRTKLDEVEASKLLPSTCFQDCGTSPGQNLEDISELQFCNRPGSDQVALGVMHYHDELRVPIESVEVDSVGVKARYNYVSCVNEFEAPYILSSGSYLEVAVKALDLLHPITLGELSHLHLVQASPRDPSCCEY